MQIIQSIQNRIHTIRGESVMLDRDLAALYEVETKVLNQAVKRNLKRFPEYFMFQLTKGEYESLRLQIATLKKIPTLRFYRTNLNFSL
ncbi:MAG: ORF6N domain-containing protein [Flavobacterium sp.]|nr:ORF6N domain-containing protein [Flavobacterium sp.]